VKLRIWTVVFFMVAVVADGGAGRTMVELQGKVGWLLGGVHAQQNGFAAAILGR
jgi:hypothetical protein